MKPKEEQKFIPRKIFLRIRTLEDEIEKYLRMYNRSYLVSNLKGMKMFKNILEPLIKEHKEIKEEYKLNYK